MIPAIENFFQFQAMMASRAIRSLLNEGKISLLLGFLFLIVCIGTGAVVSLAFHNHLRAVVLEGLSIIGWVAMWRPIQIFYMIGGHYTGKRYLKRSGICLLR